MQIWNKLRQFILDSTDYIDGNIKIDDSEPCTIIGKLVESISVPTNIDEIEIRFTYLDSPLIFTVNNIPSEEFRQLAQAIYYQLKISYVIGDFEDDFLPMCH